MIKPVTYFDAGPELTVEEHCCIGAAILQDTRQTHTQGPTVTHTCADIACILELCTIYNLRCAVCRKQAVPGSTYVGRPPPWL